jgi:hypothetical protein
MLKEEAGEKHLDQLDKAIEESEQQTKETLKKLG